jgi:transcriptional regulator with XRE-family HTH domain
MAKHPIIEQLRMERRMKDLSQLAVASAFDVGPSQLSGYEQGVHSPTLDTLMKWASALDCEIKLEKKQGT